MSNDDIHEELHLTVKCRNVLTSYIKKVYKEVAAEKVKKLEEVTFDIPNSNEETAEMVKKVLADFKSNENAPKVDVQELKKLIKKEILLMQILAQKEQCPISAFVDPL